jgi:hypothetical protein
VALADGLGGVSLANLRQAADSLNLPWDEALIRKLTLLARWRMGESLKDL